MVSPAELRLEGRLLGKRYRVLRPLGQGGMGVVYAGLHEDLQRRVAIKVLVGQDGLSPRALARFRQEALAAAELGHPNIVQVTDFQVNPGEPPFLVMEMLEGESLQSLLQREGALPAARAVFIATQILAALSAAHAARIVHRDIKPGNVFISGTPAVGDLVKVLDFGIAKVLRPAEHAPQSAAGSIVGTPAYMAPEQALTGDVDARADIYAVGACLYEMLSGRRPFGGASSGEVITRIVTEDAAPLRSVAPSVPPELCAVVDRALAKEPDQRPESALAMVRALAPWVRAPSSGDVAALATATLRDGPPLAQRTAAPTERSPSQRTVEPTIALTPRPRPPMSALVILLVSVVVLVGAAGGIGGVLVAMKLKGRAAPAAPTATTAPSSPFAVPGFSRYAWSAIARPYPGALVGDGTEDLAMVITALDSGGVSFEIAVLDGSKLSLAWRSKPRRAWTTPWAVTVVGTRVVAITETHEVTVFDGATGAALHVVPTDAAMSQVCTPRGATREVWIEAAKGTELTLDVESGALRPGDGAPPGCVYRDFFGHKAGKVPPRVWPTVAPHTTLAFAGWRTALTEGDLAVTEGQKDGGDDVVTAYDLTTKKELWSRNDRRSHPFPYVIDLIEGSVFVQDQDAVEQIDARTGKTSWKTPLELRTPITQVTVGPTRVYIGGVSGLFIADRAGKILARVTQLTPP